MGPAARGRNCAGSPDRCQIERTRGHVKGRVALARDAAGALDMTVRERMIRAPGAGECVVDLAGDGALQAAGDLARAHLLAAG